MEAATGGEGLGAVWEFVEDTFEQGTGGSGILAVTELPHGGEGEPLGPFEVRLLGKSQEEADLLEAAVGLVQVVGKEASEFFARGDVIWIAGELGDTLFSLFERLGFGNLRRQRDARVVERVMQCRKRDRFDALLVAQFVGGGR